MDPSDQMHTEWQLMTLSQRFAYYLDTNAFDDMAALFTSDGVFERAGVALKGHSEILQAMHERPSMTTRHLLSNFHFTGVTADSARGVVCLVVYHGPVPTNGEPVNYATENGRVMEFHDHYARLPEGWRISSRVARPILQPKIWP